MHKHINKIRKNDNYSKSSFWNSPHNHSWYLQLLSSITILCSFGPQQALRQVLVLYLVGNLCLHSWMVWGIWHWLTDLNKDTLKEKDTLKDLQNVKHSCPYLHCQAIAQFPFGSWDQFHHQHHNSFYSFIVDSEAWEAQMTREKS